MHDDQSTPVATSKQVIVFLGLTLLFSAAFYCFIATTGQVGGGNGLYELGLMWSPALAAVLACIICRLSPRTLGWSWGAWRWQWLALLIPLAYTVLAYGAVWIFGFGGFPDPVFVAATRKSLGWVGAPDAVVVGGYFALVATAGMALSLAFALGEEIGWRGYLAPRMTQMFGFRAGGVATGVIWGAWHLPLIFFANYSSAAPRWYAIACFFVLTIGMSVVMAWLRLRSGSLWTGALLHASHNQLIQVFFTPATQAHGTITAFAIDEFGFALPLIVLVLAAFIWITARSNGRAGPAPFSNGLVSSNL